jgi:hypothetical protein
MVCADERAEDDEDPAASADAEFSAFPSVWVRLSGSMDDAASLTAVSFSGFPMYELISTEPMGSMFSVQS